MDENKLRFGVGVLVISAIGIGIILVFLFGAFPSVLTREYSLSAVFPSAEGIAVNTPVMRDGVRIGRVSSIDLRPEGGVLVTLSMDSQYELTHRYIPRIGSGNFVTGDAQLEFVRATEPMLVSIFGQDRAIIDKPYSDGDYMNYGTRSQSLFELQGDMQDTFSSIQTAGEAIATAGESVNELANEVREIVGGADSRFDEVTEQTLATLEEFQAVLQDVRSITGNPEIRQNIETTIAQLPEVLDGMQQALDSADSVFATLESAGAQFEQVGIVAEETVKNVNTTITSAGRTIENLEQFTEPLAERGDELVDQAIRSLASLESSLGQVEEFGKSLNNSDGTLKRFLEDDDIYWQVKRTVENVESATARIQPILDDVRVFTDKIARDPQRTRYSGGHFTPAQRIRTKIALIAPDQRSFLREPPIESGCVNIACDSSWKNGLESVPRNDKYVRTTHWGPTR